jgi:hypothetical protein
MLDERELENIAWRAGRGCHYEDVFLHGSDYARQVIQSDVPLLIAEIRRLRAAQEPAADGSANNPSGTTVRPE